MIISSCFCKTLSSIDNKKTLQRKRKKILPTSVFISLSCSQDMSQSNLAKFDPVTKVWTGPMGRYPYPMTTFVGELLLKSLDENPDKIVQINHDEETVWVAKDLKFSSIRVAQNLIKLGIKPDDVIGFNTRNTEKVYPLILGCILSGALANPLHVSFTKDGIKQMFGQTQPKIVICDFDVYETMKISLDELKSNAKIYTTIEIVSEVSFVDELLTPTGTEKNFIPIKFDTTSDRKATSIMCSSGTTGEPKGVLRSHVYVLSWQTLITQPSQEPFKTFSFTPIYWGSGVSGLQYAVLNPNETRISTRHPFSIELLIEIVEKYRPLQLTLPPTYLVPFLNSPLSKACDFSSVKVIISYGSIVTEEIREKFKNIFPDIFLSTYYGMTEGPATYAFKGDSYHGLSVGKIATNIFLKVVDENENNLGFNEQGEVRIKYEFGYPGYYKNPKANEEAFDSEGFLKTGDIGYFDEEATLYLTGRLKEVFKHGEFDVSFDYLPH